MKKGMATKERIVAQAAPVFNQRGFEGTSLSELMAATGLKKGGIYRHFKSKEALAVASFGYAWQQASSARWSDVDTAAGAIAQLTQFINNFIAKRKGLVDGGCPLLNTAVDSDDGNPALRRKVEHALDQWILAVRILITRGIRHGEIRKTVNAEQSAIIIVSGLEGASMLRRLQRSDAPLITMQKHLLSFIDGLKV